MKFVEKNEFCGCGTAEEFETSRCLGECKTSRCLRGWLRAAGKPWSVWENVKPPSVCGVASGVGEPGSALRIRRELHPPKNEQFALAELHSFIDSSLFSAAQ